MKIIIIFTLSLFLKFSYSQNSNKKNYLYDENWKSIDKNVFQKKTWDRKYVYKLVETDTGLIGKIHLREKIGKLNTKDRITLINNLKKITNTQIDSSKNIVINFYYKKPKKASKGSCIDHYTSDYKYQRYFKKSNTDLQFFITEKGYIYNKKNVFEDKDNSIRMQLFKYNFGCGNYIIIKKNGGYLRRFGEYNQDNILKQLKSNWKKSR